MASIGPPLTADGDVTQRFTLSQDVLHSSMIRSLRHKGLHELFSTGRGAKIRPDLRQRSLNRLDVIHRAIRLEEIDIVGFALHWLQGSPTRYAVRVNGPWRITFDWDEGDAWRVDLEQYH